VGVTDQLVQLHPSLLFTAVEYSRFAFLDKRLLSVFKSRRLTSHYRINNDQSQIASFGLGFIIEKVPKSSKAAEYSNEEGHMSSHSHSSPIKEDAERWIWTVPRTKLMEQSCCMRQTIDGGFVRTVLVNN
jgi:hypothetical protein